MKSLKNYLSILIANCNEDFFVKKMCQQGNLYLSNNEYF